ncbi:MAG: OmpP1/FadL family transporter [Thermoanaerobaculia bacterium]
MTRRHRPTWPRLGLSLPFLLLAAVPAFPAGFQIAAHGARASGMGLAFVAIANDPSAIYYNPAGLGWQKHFSGLVGGSLLTKVEGEFQGSNPFPGEGVQEDQHKTTFVLPTTYGVVPLTDSVNFGIGIFAPYGLGFRWDEAETFTGRFIAQNAVIQSSDINPVLSWQVSDQFALAVGADVRFAKVTLERNQGAINPFTQSVVDVAHVKLNSDLVDNSGWGWNAGFLWKPVPMLSFGAQYRSAIEIDFDGEARFTQRPTGNAAFDALVATQLPQGTQDVATTVEFPTTANLGMAVNLPGDLVVALQADWTEWSVFETLLIDFENAAIPDLVRNNDWEDSWAYRAGIEKAWGNFALRAGYYFDETPQPIEDVGPLLADADRDAYTLGFGYNTERWGVDVSDIYIIFDERDTTGSNNTDRYFGEYSEAANLFAIGFRVSF